jgi:hypothetical protein
MLMLQERWVCVLHIVVLDSNRPLCDIHGLEQLVMTICSFGISTPGRLAGRSDTKKLIQQYYLIKNTTYGSCIDRLRVFVEALHDYLALCLQVDFIDYSTSSYRSRV